MGVVGPVRQAYIHKLVPGEKRATVVSFDSMVANLGGVGGQAGLGYLAQVRDYATGYIAGGAVTVLAVPLYLGIRSLKEDADKIIGKAGKKQPVRGARARQHRRGRRQGVDGRGRCVRGAEISPGRSPLPMPGSASRSHGSRSGSR